LARAAVSGDEKALDLFASNQSNFGNRMKLSVGRKEGLTFYVGLSAGKKLFLMFTIRGQKFF